MFTIDHIFVFISPETTRLDTLINHGFLEGSGNVHPGQGTSNRRFFFNNFFLEFIWVSSREEATSSLTAPTRLWERSRSNESGFSPFGICVKPQSAESTLVNCWEYHPQYLPKDIAIKIAQGDNYPAEPMFFQTPDMSKAKSSRKTKPEPKNVHELKNLTIHLPKEHEYSPTCKHLANLGVISIEKNDTYPALTLTFSEITTSITLAPEIPLNLQKEV